MLLERLVITALHRFHFRGSGSLLEMRTLQVYALCYVTSGRGILTINGSANEVKAGDLFILTPGMIIEGKVDLTAPIHYILFLFSCVQIRKHKKNWHVQQPEFPIRGKLTCVATSAASSVREQIVAFMNEHHHEGEQARITMKYRLHMLLFHLMSEKEQDGKARVGMEHVIAYIAENYMKEIRSSELAKMAGFSVNHFTKSFKNQMNMTPMEYVQKLRMTRAKELLFSPDKMKEVARQVGYKDEHYFSRIFKQSEGVAPTLYIKNKCQRIATMYYGLDDYLITLGVNPVATMSYAGRVSHTDPVPILNEGLEGRARLDSLKLNYDLLIRTKPDLILTSDRYQPGDALHQIAPTTMLKHSNHCEPVLSYMANIMDRRQQAEEWMDQYAGFKHSVQSKLNERWGKQTAYFIRVRPSYYRIYGTMNQTGTLLYEDLGLNIPRNYPQQEWAVDVQLSDMSQFHADHIFLMVDPTEEARKQLQLLIHSEQWAELQAVQQHQVHDASDLLFKTLGPIGRMWAMRHVAAQLKIESDFVHRK